MTIDDILIKIDNKFTDLDYTNSYIDGKKIMGIKCNTHDFILNCFILV